MVIGLKKNEYGRMWDETVFVYPKQIVNYIKEKCATYQTPHKSFTKVSPTTVSC
jgi:hypothetical protein